MGQINRRAMLGGGGAAALSGALTVASPEPGHAAAGGPANVPAALTPEALLDSFVRLRASTDGKIAFGWLDSLRYAVIEGEIFPLHRLLSFAVKRFRKVSSQRYEAVSLEVAHYVDIASGELLDTLVMPRTGKTVKVPRYRTGPKTVAFGVSIDESETVGAGIPREQLKPFAPVGDIRLLRSVSEPRLENGMLYVRHEEYGRVTPRDAAGARIFYREWTQWYGPAALALDSKVPSAPCQNSYAALTSWRPWMEMGAVPGHTADNGRGSKIASLAQLPENILRLTERVAPDVLDNPEKALDGAPR
jgi:Protein of unknown function (DUF1838)